MAAIRRQIQRIVVVMCLLAQAHAQSNTRGGTLTGRLTDLYSVPLAGVTVTVRNMRTGEEARTVTAKNGGYTFKGIAAGEYSLDAESTTQERGHLEGIFVSPGGEARIQAAIELMTAQASPTRIAPATTTKKAVIETTNVTTNLQMPAVPHAALNTDASNIAAVLAVTPLTALTLEGKPYAASNAPLPEEMHVTALLQGSGSDNTTSVTPQTLATEQIPSPPSSERDWMSTSASSPVENSFTHDTSPNSLEVGGIAMHSAFANTDANIVDGIAVESTLHTAAATNTTYTGRKIDIETSHSINELHGQGFILQRQNVWGAQNPFSQWIQQSAPATSSTVPVFTPLPYTPPDREITWGVGLGGHIRQDKIFWFAALDGMRRNNPGLATVKHPDDFFAQPSNDQMQVLSARLGLNSARPVTEGIAAYSSMMTTLAGLLGPAARQTTQWTGFTRLEWKVSEKNNFTVAATAVRSSAPGGGFSRLSEAYGNHSFGARSAREERYTARWQAYLTENLLLVSQGAVAHTKQSTHAEPPSAFEQTFLAPNSWGQLPQIVVDSRYGFTIGNPSFFGAGSLPDEHIYSAQQNLSWAHNTTLIRAGMEFNHNADATTLLRNQTGTYYYSNAVNFASDALAFSAFGMKDALNAANPHNCDQTGKVWRDSAGNLRGLGNLPCYSYYSQMIGPSSWHVQTNNLAGFATLQWQPRKLIVISTGLRWEQQQLPQPIAALANPDLPLTQKLPSLGNFWAPRASIAVGNAEEIWPVVRVGYGMYRGRMQNAVLETALTQTGSPNGDQYFFMQPTNNLPGAGGGAPPFPYVLAGSPSKVVKPGAVEFAPEFHNPEIHQAEMALEKSLPGHVAITATAVASLARRLPISMDTNFDSSVNPQTITYAVVDGTGKGPIQAQRLTVPFYASWPSTTGTTGRLNPSYQQIVEIFSRANSTYTAAILQIAHTGRKGIQLHARYTYAHATDWNPNESAQVAGSDVLDPANFHAEYGTSNLDVRHTATATMTYETPWKLHGVAGILANHWMLSDIGSFRSGLPYTMRTSGSLAKKFTQNGALIAALGPGMNGSGGDNRVYGVGRNTYRYPTAWKMDMRIGKRFDLGTMRQLELLAESFNLMNHQNVTEIETTGYTIESGSANGGLPTLNFLTGLKANTTAFGQPLNVNATNFYRQRQIQLGVKMRF